ncbi:MAG: CPBP family intramembrane metalloprotease [Chloroflexaceae bacterium]|nr:CPBP family intramembrane metalloprotease [Chloroflexaceae bacterium]
MDETSKRPGAPAGLLAACCCALLLIGSFAAATWATPMPAAERWAALMAFGLLTLAYVAQGSIGLYDGLGRTVQRNGRALLALLALLPVLYLSYSLSVGEFNLFGVVIALIFVALPATAMWLSRGERLPTLLDVVAILYLWLSLEFQLVPGLTLPQQGGLVGFFQLSAVPLLLVLLAARGWPGLGFSWFLSWNDLRVVLLATAGLALVLIPLGLATGFLRFAPTAAPALELLGRAVFIYFLVALPEELLFRGVIQNGLTRVLEERKARTGNQEPRTENREPGDEKTGDRRPRVERSTQYAVRSSQDGSSWLAALREPPTVALVISALMFGASHLNNPPLVGHYFVLATLAGLAYGWVYQRTGKVTASAVVHLLVNWLWSLLFVTG